MKKFLLSFLQFIFPFLLLVLAIELYVLYSPSTFNRKAEYLQANAGNAGVLILGSSHNQNALNPEFLKLTSINLANAGQDVQLDSALFFKYVPQMNRLKAVILELDYFTLEEKNDKENFRLPWYKRFFDIELYPVSFYNRISLYASSPSFFNKLLVDAVNPKKIKYQINKFGFIVNDFPGIMEDLKYDSLALAKTAAQRLAGKHAEVSLYNARFNKVKLNAIINFCIAHKLEVILLSAPMYKTYVDNEVPEKNARRFQYIDSLQMASPVIHYFNYEKDVRFNVRDFKNDDHLNSNGAKKYSLIIDSLLNKIVVN